MNLVIIMLWINLLIASFVCKCADADLIKTSANIYHNGGINETIGYPVESSAEATESLKLNLTNVIQTIPKPKRVKIRRKKWRKKKVDRISMLPERKMNELQRSNPFGAFGAVNVKDDAYRNATKYGVRYVHKDAVELGNNDDGRPAIIQTLPTTTKNENNADNDLSRTRKYRRKRPPGSRTMSKKMRFALAKRRARKKAAAEHSAANVNRTEETTYSVAEPNLESLQIPQRPLRRSSAATLSHWENVNHSSIIGLDDNNETATLQGGSDEDELVVGDLSCLKNGFHPAPVVLNANIKYLRNDLLGTDNVYIEAEYICRPGYTLKLLNHSTSIYCRNNKWIGRPPECKKKNSSNSSSSSSSSMSKRRSSCRQQPSKCKQICHRTVVGTEQCSCFKGFRLSTIDNNQCIDINECRENKTICKLGCTNTMGSYRCVCPKGLQSADAGACIDINECLLRNGHGPCQDTCSNVWGGYTCSCIGLPGTTLSADQHSCEDLDECSTNNGGCSHTCLNTMGRAFCLCPLGWTLDTDWKTCIDIDECSDPDGGRELCPYVCENTPGSYKCITDFGADQPPAPPLEALVDLTSCPNGYEFNLITQDCEDIDECRESAGLQCHQNCENTVGSYHCTCNDGYMFALDKHTCVGTADNSSYANVECPPLFPPKHGYLECSRPQAMSREHDRIITNRPGSQCSLRCPNGYRETGKFDKICDINGQWFGEETGSCIEYPAPILICPPDVLVETPPNESTVNLQLAMPTSDVSWERDIMVNPTWAKNGRLDMGVGTQRVYYVATHPVSRLSKNCSVLLTILDGEPPMVLYCPKNQQHVLRKFDDSVQLSWTEPFFNDNVNVTSITKSNSPGSYFSVGSHRIVYTAHDAAGFKTRCVFKVIVISPKNHHVYQQLPIYQVY